MRLLMTLMADPLQEADLHVIESPAVVARDVSVIGGEGLKPGTKGTRVRRSGQVAVHLVRIERGG
jgi:hypothetical protein